MEYLERQKYIINNPPVLPDGDGWSDIERACAKAFSAYKNTKNRERALDKREDIIFEAQVKAQERGLDDTEVWRFIDHYINYRCHQEGVE
jgi:hypothetical protein